VSLHWCLEPQGSLECFLTRQRPHIYFMVAAIHFRPEVMITNSVVGVQALALKQAIQLVHIEVLFATGD